MRDAAERECPAQIGLESISDAESDVRATERVSEQSNSQPASKPVRQADRQAGRQAGVPDGYGNHRTCFQAAETTKRAQTNLALDHRPFIVFAEEASHGSALGSARLDSAADSAG